LGILGLSFDGFFLAALLAAVNDFPLIGLIKNFLGLHQSLATTSSVTGMVVDMERPKAGRAVVSIAIAKNLLAAVEANKVFLGGALEVRGL